MGRLRVLQSDNERHLWIIMSAACVFMLALLGKVQGTRAEDHYERGLRAIVSAFLDDRADNASRHLIDDTPLFDKNQTPTPDPSGGGLFPKFPCSRMKASAVKPHSVHRLRPADINVVAAIGDSLTAGKAAGTRGVTAVLFDYRGLSWSVGGDGTFDTLHSLPNIIREYNPDLYGFSNSIGDLMSKPSRLNVAKSGATSNDLAFQAALLIQRLKNDPFVNFTEDWKVITILIGGNDLCRSCKATYTPKRYIHRLKSALDILHDSVPRAFINLVEIMPVELARLLPRNAFCHRIETYYCQCAVKPKSESQYKRLIADRREYQRLTEQLVSSGVYDDKEDFTVVLQPFYRNFTIPLVPGTANIDYSLLAVDCFHLSLRGHSQAGLGLWNNMLQPLGEKSTDWNITRSLLCPTQSRPFLATAKNSDMLRKAHYEPPIHHDFLENNTDEDGYANKIIPSHNDTSHNEIPLDQKNLVFGDELLSVARENRTIEIGDRHVTIYPPGVVGGDDVTLYPPSSPFTNISSNEVIILTELDAWQIWYMVLGWTLLMSTVFALCVAVRNAKRDNNYTRHHESLSNFLNNSVNVK